MTISPRTETTLRTWASWCSQTTTRRVRPTGYESEGSEYAELVDMEQMACVRICEDAISAAGRSCPAPKGLRLQCERVARRWLARRFECPSYGLEDAAGVLRGLSDSEVCTAREMAREAVRLIDLGQGKTEKPSAASDGG